MAEVTGRIAGLYELLDALRATKKITKEYTDGVNKNTMVLEVSVWSEKETDEIKQEILKQLNLLINNE